MFKEELNNLAIDFDGVIHKSSKGYYDGTIYDVPIEGSKEALRLLSTKYNIIIHTSKCIPSRPLVNGKTGKELVWEWLKTYKLDLYVDEVMWGKPRAKYYIDDKAIRFTTWNEVIKKIAPLVAIIIPVRFKSSRFPGKSLELINGKSMLERVAVVSTKVVGTKKVFIATDNKRIEDFMKYRGYKVIMTSKEHKTGTDRVAEAVNSLKEYDIIINLQGDEPIITEEAIQKVIDAKTMNPDKVINAMTKNEDVISVLTNQTGDLMHMSRKHKYGNYKQVGIYAFNKQELLAFASNKRTKLEKQEDVEILRCLDLGLPVKMIKVPYSHPVNYPEDIELVESKI